MLTRIKKIISPFSAVLISVGLIAALYLIALAATSYQVNSGATTTVNEWSTCKRVTNANAKALFVPTNTTGEWSAFRTNKPGDVTLAECTSSQPQSLLIPTTGKYSVVLNWTAPSDAGGSAITNYKVYRGTTSGGETLLTTLGNVLTYADTGLTYGAIYYYKVSAVNSYGEGTLSSEALGYPGANRVFVTSTTYQGNLGGVAGANGICQTRADAASLGGRWRALICSSAQNATSVPTYNVGNVFIRLDGRVISNSTNSPNDLFDGTINNSFNYTELGTVLNDVFGNQAWTGCTTAGINNVTTPWTCDDWTTSSGTGPPYKNGYDTRDYGNYLNATDYGGYIGSAIDSCQAYNSLICIQKDYDSIQSVYGYDTCDSICAAQGMTCLSMGLDGDASNGQYYGDIGHCYVGLLTGGTCSTAPGYGVNDPVDCDSGYGTCRCTP